MDKVEKEIRMAGPFKESLAITGIELEDLNRVLADKSAEARTAGGGGICGGHCEGSGGSICGAHCARQ